MSKEDKPTAKKRYFVSGMHCAACEVLLEKDIGKLDGVVKVDATLKNCEVEIISEDSHKIPTLESLNELFKDLGYKFHNDKIKERSLTKNDFGKVGLIFAVFIITFFLLGNTTILTRFSVGPTSSPPSYFILGILAGLSSCAALVGGMLLALSSQWNLLYNGNSKKSVRPFLYFNTSRIIAFAILGGLLGLIGSVLKISITFASIMTLLVSLLMLAIGLQLLGVSWFKGFKVGLPKFLSRHISDEQNFKGKYMPMFAGALTFFIPCGFTLIAQTNALNSGSLVNGALMLLLFSLGTLPILALISFTSVRFYSNPKFSKKFSLFAGMLVTFFAFYTLNSQLNVLGVLSLNDLKTVFSKDVGREALAVGDIQYFQMEAKGFSYYPRKVSLKAGVKTRWEIYNSGASGCASGVYAREFFPEVIYLQPGLNVVEFTPEKPGKYKVSCSMGMVDPVIVTVY